MAYLIKCETPEDGWRMALGLIEGQGAKVRTEDNQMTKEFLNLLIEIKNPLAGWPFKGTWNLTKLNKYAAQLLEVSYDCKGFDYMYNERMGRQKYYVIKKLKENLATRRATMYLWIPEKDLETGLHSPCQVIADYKYRDGSLRATHVFRSHDFGGAWTQNVYALARLQEQIAGEVGVVPGELITHSISAHCYEY